MRLPQLKIKLKSLAAESKIIRQTELGYLNKAADLKFLHSMFPNDYPKYPEYREEMLAIAHDISQHRRLDVRLAARHSYLAYGFLRGIPYYKIERSRYTDPSIATVADIVARFGGMDRSVAHAEVSKWYLTLPLDHNSNPTVIQPDVVPSSEA